VGDLPIAGTFPSPFLGAENGLYWRCACFYGNSLVGPTVMSPVFMSVEA
jgi:hypothetical protein